MTQSCDLENDKVEDVLLAQLVAWSDAARNSEALAERIAEILCQNGASDRPHARSEDLE